MMILHAINKIHSKAKCPVFESTDIECSVNVSRVIGLASRGISLICITFLFVACCATGCFKVCVCVLSIWISRAQLSMEVVIRLLSTAHATAGTHST